MELKQQVKNLKNTKEFAEESQVLERAREGFGEQSEDFHWIEQQRALCTYKAVLDILKAIGQHDTATKPKETLGINGAVYKRMLEPDGNEAHLRAARDLYLRGWQCAPRGTTLPGCT